MKQKFVKCTNNAGYKANGVTVGIVYEVIAEITSGIGTYLIKDDFGDFREYYKIDFVPIKWIDT